MNIIEELEWRELIYSCTDVEGLREKINEGPLTLYCGFDPTAESLHLGNLLPIVTLMRFEKYGHRILGLIGGSTGMIGDPGGKNAERNLLDEETLNNNLAGLKKTLERFISFEGENKMVNNYDWTKDINTIEFLRDYGKYFSINYMLAKESVKSRLETGISYTEFSYMILQALDFKYLYDNENCILQIGGQDQWGNITAGFELVRKVYGEHKAFALTMPLLLKSDGTKFGKSAGGSLWLDKEKTSPYELYQFLLNSDDDLVIKLLKYYTFLTKEEIDDLAVKVENEPHLREAQKVLGKEVVTLVHGENAFNEVIKITEALFSGDIKSLSESEIKDAFKGVPSIEVEGEANILDLLVSVNAASSKREAREFVSNGAILLNGDKFDDVDSIVDRSIALFDKYVVIRRGKKNYYLVSFK